MKKNKPRKVKRYTVHYYDKYDYDLVNKAHTMHSILVAIYDYLRSQHKYHNKYTEVYQMLIDIMNEYNFDVYE